MGRRSSGPRPEWEARGGIARCRPLCWRVQGLRSSRVTTCLLLRVFDKIGRLHCAVAEGTGHNFDSRTRAARNRSNGSQDGKPGPQALVAGCLHAGTQRTRSFHERVGRAAFSSLETLPERIYSAGGVSVARAPTCLNRNGKIRSPKARARKGAGLFLRPPAGPHVFIPLLSFFCV